jgi:hypothetical protein
MGCHAPPSWVIRGQGCLGTNVIFHSLGFIRFVSPVLFTFTQARTAPLFWPHSHRDYWSTMSHSQPEAGQSTLANVAKSFIPAKSWLREGCGRASVQLVVYSQPTMFSSTISAACARHSSTHFSTSSKRGSDHHEAHPIPFTVASHLRSFPGGGSGICGRGSGSVPI